jgi:hypothetical protein
MIYWMKLKNSSMGVFIVLSLSEKKVLRNQGNNLTYDIGIHVCCNEVTWLNIPPLLKNKLLLVTHTASEKNCILGSCP